MLLNVLSIMSLAKRANHITMTDAQLLTKLNILLEHGVMPCLTKI